MGKKSISYSALGIAAGSALEVGPLPDWLTVTPMSGSGDGVLLIETTQSTISEDRSYTVIVKSTVGDLSVAITVTQEAGGPYLWVDSKGQSSYRLQVPGDGGTFDVGIISNVSWKVYDAEYLVSESGDEILLEDGSVILLEN